MTGDRPVRLAAAYARDLTFQKYPVAPCIAGVWQRDLNKRRGENGAFMEVLRLTGGEGQDLPTTMHTRQLSVSWAAPGRLNAFHIHLRPQNELWCVLSGQLGVWLVDCRADSPTVGSRRPFLLSAEQPSLLHIPSGVAHGYRAGSAGATLLYAADAQFDAADPDEGRLPWNYFGDDLWMEDRG
ncbi:dTDP-4-dehydrorhamnose 3,5-epimerase [Deinococcus metalli]|uniref:LPS biosynthesis protein n=1 Tax=Deinococcus metalli TaxID=1141878 RepID=A0A7W8KEX3_9DEIO|nr:dTDP-4-dehydrorhamnose 3,5-epimerase family protein [Deinococcus metalli]MBB5375766.1 dTDP-4-dehydrorhamnose 3,5-epimerase [Deinococcus metalli]GHF37212.1 LPS biosynthesis protein [Deinococcus metalli]